MFFFCVRLPEVKQDFLNLAPPEGRSERIETATCHATPILRNTNPGLLPGETGECCKDSAPKPNG